RSVDNALQERLMALARELATEVAARHGLELTLATRDRSYACQNDAEATALVERAFAAERLAVRRADGPSSRSEEYGLVGSVAKSALFVLGAGVDHPRLHNPDYDFPDVLIGQGVRLFERVARELCG